MERKSASQCHSRKYKKKIKKWKVFMHHQSLGFILYFNIIFYIWREDSTAKCLDTNHEPFYLLSTSPTSSPSLFPNVERKEEKKEYNINVWMIEPTPPVLHTLIYISSCLFQLFYHAKAVKEKKNTISST